MSSTKHEEEGIHGDLLEDFGSGLKRLLGFMCIECKEEHPGKRMASAVTSRSSPCSFLVL